MKLNVKKLHFTPNIVGVILIPLWILSLFIFLVLTDEMEITEGGKK